MALLPLPDQLADVETLIAAIRQAFDAVEKHERWHYVDDADEPAFTAGFSNFSASYRPAAFRRNAVGDVHLYGYLKATGGLGQGNAQSCFTLPEGYRPSNALVFPCTGVAGGVNYTGIVEVLTNGQVKVTLQGLAAAAAITSVAVVARFRPN